MLKKKEKTLEEKQSELKRLQDENKQVSNGRNGNKNVYKKIVNKNNLSFII